MKIVQSSFQLYNQRPAAPLINMVSVCCSSAALSASVCLYRRGVRSGVSHDVKEEFRTHHFANRHEQCPCSCVNESLSPHQGRIFGQVPILLVHLANFKEKTVLQPHGNQERTAAIPDV